MTRVWWTTGWKINLLKDTPLILAVFCRAHVKTLRFIVSLLLSTLKRHANLACSNLAWLNLALALFKITIVVLKEFKISIKPHLTIKDYRSFKLLFVICRYNLWCSLIKHSQGTSGLANWVQGLWIWRSRVWILYIPSTSEFFRGLFGTFHQVNQLISKLN